MPQVFASATPVESESATQSRDRSRYLAFVLMVASGSAALGYQIVWTQQAALWLGHEAAAVLAVVAAFFGGLSVGALALGARIERSAQPARWYAACEAVIGLWGLTLALTMSPIAHWLFKLIGVQPSPIWHWCVAFGGTFLLLLPATAAMGATLPAMERVLANMQRSGKPIAALYAGNTFGAVLGVLATAFWLIPNVGLTLTATACALLNVLCAVVAYRAFVGPTPRAVAVTRPGRMSPQVLLAATGLLGIGYEVIVVRVLAQVTENTVYTFAILLAVYLVGTALGAAGYARWPVANSDAPALRDRLLRALCASCLVGMVILVGSENLEALILRGAGGSMAGALFGEAVLATAAFLFPTVIMGALFSHLCTTARDDGIGFAQALGVNTLGAAIAPLLFGIVLVPMLGAHFALLLVAAGYLVLTSSRGWLVPTQWITVAAVAALVLWGPSLAIVDVPEGGRIVSYREGTMATVSVVEDGTGVTSLRINNRQQEGSNATRFADARQALLPLLLHPSPRRALFLGLGTGVTAYSAGEDPALQVDAVELLPEVIEASAHFTGTFTEATGSQRPRLIAADARRFVRASEDRYDVIVADNFHPARGGSGALYTVEHFAAVRERLAPDGIFCQWLPLHQLDLQTLRSIVRSFLAVYPHAVATLATNSLDTPVIGLVARSGDERFDADALRRRAGDLTTPQRLRSFGLADEFAVLGSLIAGPTALARFAGNAPINTDDHPVVAYLAPHVTYAPDSMPRDRLIALLREIAMAPDDIAVDSVDAAWTSRLQAYRNARNRFIEIGRDVHPTTDVRAMVAQVRDPLLSVLRISPDFRPAYDPLVRMAVALGDVDVAAARWLLLELQRVHPADADVATALGALARMPP